jgi:hypothetical protein
VVDEIIGLSAADVSVLKEVIRTVGKLRENSQIRDQSDSHRVSPDVYIARARGVITAATSATPGTGIADIYYLNPSTGDLVQQGLYQTVYNIAPIEIADSTYVLVAKDKFGKWIVVRGDAGGSFPLVRFEITDPDCSTGTATAIITAVSCDASTPQVGNVITLLDEDGWFNGETNPTINGRTGTAHKFNIPYSGGYTQDDCSYVIISLSPAPYKC